MKKFLILACVCALTNSLTIPSYYHQQETEQYEHVHEHKKPPVPIIKHDFEQHHEGYQYSYETGNGIHVQESGHIKNKGDKKHESLVQKGSVTYHDEHGHPITLTYVADEHGFQPQGEHLPTPPPLPIELAKAIHENEQAHAHALAQASHSHQQPQAEEEHQQYSYY